MTVLQRSTDGMEEHCITNIVIFSRDAGVLLSFLLAF
jgi:hypothetical protein